MSYNFSFQDLYADSLACIGKSDKISEATSSKIKILQDQRDKLLRKTRCIVSMQRGVLIPKAEFFPRMTGMSGTALKEIREGSYIHRHSDV